MRGVLIILVLAFCVGRAEACEETALSAKEGEMFLAAQNALIVDRDTDKAKNLLDIFEEQAQGCYAKRQALLVRAQIESMSGNYANVTDLPERALHAESVSGEDAAFDGLSDAELLSQLALGSEETGFSIDPVASGADDPLRPLSPPLPVYPSDALAMGLEAECEVQFDVDVRGTPYNVVATCTDSLFTGAAEDAMEGVRFAPKIINGQAAERRNVVYPMAFRLAD